MVKVFLVTLAERSDNGGAIDVPPNVADMSAVVDGFEYLFPLLNQWRRKCGPEFTAYAMAWTRDSDGSLTAGYVEAWESFGSMYRLDYLPGEYVKVSDYTGNFASFAQPVQEVTK